MWLKYNRKPKDLLWKNIQPIEEITKRGLELFVNVSNRSASTFVIKFLLYRFSVQIAPMGYPQNIPRKKAKEQQPGTLNKGLIMGSKNLPIILERFVFIKMLQITKKGNKDGKITLTHKFIPSLLAKIASFE